MTDKEKAEEYVNALLNKDDTELDKFLDANLGNLKLNSKQAGTLIGILEGVGICSCLYGLSEGRKETTEKISALEKENSELKERLKGFENGEVAWQGDMDRTIEQNLRLKEEVEALKARMDRMKKFLPAYMLNKYFEEDK